MPRLTLAAKAYRMRVFAGLPVYSTRLVREQRVTFAERLRLNSPAEAAPVLRRYFATRDREEIIVVLLDAGLTMTGLVRVSVGGLRSAVLEPAQIFKAAILASAGSILVAHNHPSGNPEPSREDVSATRALVAAGRLLGIPVQDHLIVTDTGITSLMERGLIEAPAPL